MKNDVYVEGSLRAGSVHDDARNVLRDANGAPYSYEMNANYFGGHVGVGKEIPLANGDAVDVYGKYFVNRRNSVDFNAGGHYDKRRAYLIQTHVEVQSFKVLDNWASGDFVFSVKPS